MKYVLPVITAGAIATGGLGLAGIADAAPSGPTTASEAVSTLQGRVFM